MKTYKVIKISTMWSTNSLTEKVEKLRNEKTRDGYEIVTVAFLGKHMVDTNSIYHGI